MCSRASCLAALLILSLSRTVLGQRPTPDSIAIAVDSQVGWTQGRHNGGATFGVSPLVRYKLLAAGASLQGATTGFNAMGSASALFGFSVPTEFVRVDVLAELGINSYSGVGANFLSQDPGASATLPFAGARSALLVRLFRNSRGQDIWIGPSIHYAKDLRSTGRSYSYHYQGYDWISGTYDDYWETNSVRIGQSRLCYMITVGVSIFP